MFPCRWWWCGQDSEQTNRSGAVHRDHLRRDWKHWNKFKKVHFLTWSCRPWNSILKNRICARAHGLWSIQRSGSYCLSNAINCDMREDESAQWETTKLLPYPRDVHPTHDTTVFPDAINYRTPPATLNLNARILGIWVKFTGDDKGRIAWPGGISSRLGSSSASSTSPARKKTEKSSWMGRWNISFIRGKSLLSADEMKAKMRGL